MLQQHLVDLDGAKCGNQIGVFGEVDALAAGVAAADVQRDADGGSEAISSLRISGGPDAVFGGFGPHRLVELNVVAAGGDDFAQFIGEQLGVGAAEGLLVGIEVGALIDAEAGEDVRAGDGLLDAATRGRGIARDFPVAGEFESENS